MVRSCLHVSLPVSLSSISCWLVVLGLVVLLAGPFSAVGFAQQASLVSGAVFDPSGAAIADAHISVRDAVTGLTIATATTDQSGAFTFQRPASGRFDVEITVALFEPVRQTISVSGSDPVPGLRFTLRPQGFAESVVVTARRVDARRADTPQKIEVIDESDIERTIAGDVTDLLKKNAGVDVIQYSGALSGIGIRGFRPQFAGLNKRSLLLIDGRPSGVVNLATLPIDDVQRIEVLKGAASAIYGSSAMGGVVNVLTRESRGPIAGQARVSFGSFDASEIGGRMGGSLTDRWDFDLGGGVFRQRDDYRMGNGVVRPATRYGTYNGSVRMGGDLSPIWRIDLRANAYRGRDIMTPGDIASGLSSQGSKDLERSSQDLRLRARLAKHEASLAIYRAFDAGHTTNVTTTNPLDTPYLPYLSFEDQRTWVGAQLRDVWQWSSSHSLVAGLDYETVDASSRSYTRTGAETAPFSANGGRRTTGVYAEQTLKLDRGRTVVTFGGRWDRITTVTVETPLKTNFLPSEATFDVFNPSVGVKRQIGSSLRLHATAGRAFIPAEAIMLTGFTTTTVGGRTQISQGNPDLQPERSTSWDVGAEWASTMTDVDITYFQTYVKDRFISNVVISRPAPPDPIVVSVVNGLDARIRGLELDVRRRAGRHITLFTNTAHYLERSEQLTSGARQAILNVPRTTVRAGLDVEAGRLTARLSARFVHGRQDNDFSAPGFPIVDYDDFTVVDTAATYRIAGRHAVVLAISNLTDTFYYEKIGFPLQGAAVSVKYRLEF